MKKPGRPLVYCLLVSALALAARAEEDTCVGCHALEEEEELALPVPEWRDSVHALHDVACDGCHGGDPYEEDADLSMSEEAGFLDNPSWTEESAWCGVCHELISFHYDRGRFGRLLESGLRVATCTTCHMQDGHRIQEARAEELLTDTSCPECIPVSRTQEKLQILAELHQREQGLAARLGRVAARGTDVRDRVDELAGAGERFANLLHRFDDSIVVASDAAHNKLDSLEAAALVHEEQADARRRYGSAILASLGLLFGSLLLYRRLA